MAINVNTVYQTVLLILNKEQRGYMTPVEYNRIATQSQLDIFDQYFDDLNQHLCSNSHLSPEDHGRSIMPPCGF
jgi:hypothetical protein